MTSVSRPVLVSKALGVATVTLNRPESLNVLDNSMLSALEAAFLDIREDAQIRCVVVTGQGRAFSAGADLREMKLLRPEDALYYSQRGQAIVGLLETLQVPTIVQLNGIALGGGCELALAATFRFASSTTLIGLPEITLGLIPGFGGTQRLSRLIGDQAARRMILLGERLDADTSLRIGLVDKVFSAETIQESTQRIANQLASSPRMALQAASRCISTARDRDLESGLKHEAQEFSTVFWQEDRVKGLNAFFDKRFPRF